MQNLFLVVLTSLFCISCTKNDNSYFYVLLKNKSLQQEYLEISNDKDIKKLEKFLLNIEEAQWLER